MQFNKLLKEAQKMQQQMADMQSKMSELRIEGNAGAGMVKLVLSGDHILKSISVDSSLLKETEKEMLEDLIVAAFNDAKSRLDTQMQSEMGKVSAGMPQLPGGIKFPF